MQQSPIFMPLGVLDVDIDIFQGLSGEASF